MILAGSVEMRDSRDTLHEPALATETVGVIPRRAYAWRICVSTNKERRQW